MIRTYKDERGTLHVIESERDIPFPIKRVFWMTECSQPRGGHLNTSPYFVVAVHGSFNAHRDDQIIPMCDPSHGVLVPTGGSIRLTSWSPGAVCLVLAGGYYESGT